MDNSPHYTSDSYISISDSIKDPLPSTSNETSKKYKKPAYIGTSSRSISCPWKKILSYTCGVVGLHEEICDFYEMMSPTPEESEIRLKVIEHITKTVHSLWPQAEVHVFGSFRTGLYLPSSDIDMVVTGRWANVPLSTLSEALKNSGIKSEDITLIPQATVPIIRMLHSPSKIRVDISFNADSGVRTAKFIKKLIKEHPPLPRLVLILKQFLIHRELNEVFSGGMSSYCLTLLIVSFLQGFYKPKTLPSTNYGTLLLEFFEHYGINFNYERVSIHFDNGGNYQPKMRDAGSYLSIEDPLVAGKDIGKGTYLMHLLKVSFQNAFHVLHKTVIESMHKQRPVNSYLELILQVDPEILEKREWIYSNYSNILRSISKMLKKFDDSEEPSPSPNTKEKKRKRKSINSFQQTR